MRLSSIIFINFLVTLYGTSAVAAFALAGKFHLLACLAIFGIGNAVSSLVGQNLGANQPERAQKTAKLAILYSVSYMTLIAIGIWTSAPYLLLVMNPSPEVLQEGITCLRFLSVTYPLFAVNSILNFTFNGAGDPKIPLKLDILNRWICRFLGGYFISRILNMGFKGNMACS